MLIKKFLALVGLVLMGAASANAQSAGKDDFNFEIGGQFSALNLSKAKAASISFIPCIVAPCPVGVVVSNSRETDPGFGGRFGYQVTSSVTLEAEINFFPRDNIFEGGRKVEGLFGARIGKRFDKVGIFGKARPGFLYESQGDFGPGQGGCPTVFPPPIGCFDSRGKTGLALDLGGVIELYPSKRTILRFDIGDTILHFGARNVPVVFNPQAASVASNSVIVTRQSETTHNLQAGVGFGFRF